MKRGGGTAGPRKEAQGRVGGRRGAPRRSLRCTRTSSRRCSRLRTRPTARGSEKTARDDFAGKSWFQAGRLGARSVHVLRNNDSVLWLCRCLLRAATALRAARGTTGKQRKRRTSLDAAARSSYVRSSTSQHRAAKSAGHVCGLPTACEEAGQEEFVSTISFLRSCEKLPKIYVISPAARTWRC